LFRAKRGLAGGCLGVPRDGSLATPRQPPGNPQPTPRQPPLYLVQMPNKIRVQNYVLNFTKRLKIQKGEYSK